MALEIQFVDRTKDPPVLVNRYLMDADNKGNWRIPEVILNPVDNLPLIRRVAVTVTGTPAVVATRIQQVFFSKDFTPPQLLQHRKGQLGILIHDAGHLHNDIDCDLTVTVHYYDSDGGSIASAERVVSKTCKLYTGKGKPVEPEIVVRPEELSVVVDEPTTLTLDLRYYEGVAPPLVVLAHPETVLAPDDPLLARLTPVLPSLRGGLSRALSLTPQGPTVSGDLRSYSLTFCVRLDQPCKTALAGLDEAPIIPLVTQLPGSKARADHCLRLESSQHPFPGWLAIDFGTTNSTVTVHDPFEDPRTPGLPAEQEKALRDGLTEWLNRPAAEALPGGRRFEEEWRKLLKEVNELLRVHSPDGLAGCLMAPGERFYELVAQLELALRPKREDFRRVVYAGLQKLYHRTLRVPSLRRRQLFPVKLDRLRHLPILLSELEIQEIQPLNKDDKKILVEMGPETQKKRLQTTAKADAAVLRQILGRFHPSPKRYFGTDRIFSVELNNQRHDVTVDQLMRAGWQHLIDRTGLARTELGEPRSDGPFRRVIVTYPTVAPPAIRQKIQRLIRDLGISDVRTDYDEAVAAAIFYLMREYGGAADIGLESFKARCRLRADGAWVQNVLVFDIGGGTTDVALIRLTLKDVPVFKAGEDRGAGGRYYRIEPELLSSTGHMQLGGEYMTLRLFHLLKGMLADRLLTLAQDGKLRSDSLKAILSGSLPENYVDAKGRYKAGQLKAFFGQEAPERGNAAQWAEAKELANLVVPTRWDAEVEQRDAKLQAFYTLWDLAEEMKLKVGARGLEADGVRPPYAPDVKQIRQLAELCRPELAPLPKDVDLRLEVPPEQFERSVGKVVNEAVAVAKGALEHLPEGDCVDWLILSGQSCNLALVDRRIREEFESSNRFVWNPERVTFEPAYAKLATSIGACFAEEYRRRNLDPEAYKPEMRRGVNVLEYAVNNLFSTLPCSFYLKLPDDYRELFTAGAKMYELDAAARDDDKRAKARTPWLASSLAMTVFRQDFKEQSNPPRWGDFAGQDLVNSLNLAEGEWRKSVKIQFEVDHRLDIDVLACRFEQGQVAPHYALTGHEPVLPLKKVLTALAEKAKEQAAAAAKPAAPAGKTAPTAPAPVPPPAVPWLFNDKGELVWRLALRIANAGTYTDLFRKNQPLELRLRPREGGSPRRGMRSEIFVEHFPEDGKLQVWGCPPGGTTWYRLGEIPRPQDDRPLFRRYYRLTLDEDGVLRIHPGEPAYWESPGDPSVLRDKPGCVYRQRLAQVARDTDEERNPFTGKH